MLKSIKKKVDRIDWLNRFEGLNPWLNIAETERSRTSRLRSKLFAKLGLNDSTVTCWVTGKHVPVKCAHILPDSSKDKVLRKLGLTAKFRNDLDAVPSNFMILDVALEEAFDSLKISFAPTDILHTEQLRLKVWDPDCRNDPVGRGSNTDSGQELTTIGAYEGYVLNVPSAWSVSKRALSYHTLCCYIYQKYKGKLSLDENEPADFSSQEAIGRDEVRRELAEMFHSCIQADDREGEDDSVDDAVDVNGPFREERVVRRRKLCAVM